MVFNVDSGSTLNSAIDVHLTEVAAVSVPFSVQWAQPWVPRRDFFAQG